MPFTHVEIEERKSRNIRFLFLAVVILYAGSLLLLLVVVKCFAGLLATRTGEFHVTWPEALAVFGASLTVATIHWMTSTHRLFDRLLDTVMAHPADQRDTYHERFSNIVQEVVVALGGRPIEPHVIATPAVNACAVMDFSGRAAIAVTEGALALLTRAQLESVIGHEAAHIAQGDSLTASISCGLFALHEEALKRLWGEFRPESSAEAEASEFMSTGLLVCVVVVLWVTKWMRKTCELLISREKEYRADAIAVRLTRNPLALAEALRTLSEQWRGVGMRGESLSSIFIMDPGVEGWSEEDGWLADWLSTHPPTEHRIQLLLGMAHLDPAHLEHAMGSRPMLKRTRLMPPSGPPAEPALGADVQWMVWLDGRWGGPFGLEALAHDGLLRPDTWVRRAEATSASLASQDPLLLELLRRQYATPGQAPSKADCPKCRVGLVTVLYEGAPIEQCPACRGCYADPDTLTRVFARQEYDFPESVKRWGDALLAVDRRRLLKERFRKLPNQPRGWFCVRCHSVVLRKFYTDAYLVEVEQCWACGLTWLDHQELELLQYLYEKRKEDE